MANDNYIIFFLESIEGFYIKSKLISIDIKGWINNDEISKHPTYVLEENKRIIGFYSIKKGFQEASLEYFYIEPNCIGQGYGKILWNHLTDQCKKMNIWQVELVTSPQAKAFYVRMGAVQIDEVSSMVMKNKKIPKLLFNCTEVY